MLYFAGTNSRFYTTYTFLTLRLSSLKRLLYELNVKLPEEDARVTDSKSKLKSFLLKNASGVASGDEPSGTRIRKVKKIYNLLLLQKRTVKHDFHTLEFFYKQSVFQPASNCLFFHLFEP